MFCKPAEKGVIVLENVTMRPGKSNTWSHNVVKRFSDTWQNVFLTRGFFLLDKSYKMMDKRRPLPLPHIKLIMRELATFHGKWHQWIVKAKVRTA